MADFLLGIPYGSSYASVKQDNDGIAWHCGFFAQDSFKVNFQADAGIRHALGISSALLGYRIGHHQLRSLRAPDRPRDHSRERNRRWTSRRLASCNRSTPAPGPSWNGIPCTPFLQANQAGWPNTLRFAQKKDFNPRFGFAYRPFNDTKTVIRGGVGRYTMTILGDVFYSLTGISSSDVREFLNSVSNSIPLFQLPQISTNGNGVTSTPYGQAYFGTANDPNFKDPYSLQWNLSVERDLGWNTGLRVSYIGLRSVQLPWAPDLNQPQPSTTPYAQRPLTDRPFPYWGRIYSRDTGANAIYNSMQTELMHRHEERPDVEQLLDMGEERERCRRARTHRLVRRYRRRTRDQFAVPALRPRRRGHGPRATVCSPPWYTNCHSAKAAICGSMANRSRMHSSAGGTSAVSSWCKPART